MKKLVTTVLMFAGFANALMADSYELDSIKMRLNVNEVVVVGNRTAAMKDNTPQKIEVVTSDNILRLPQKDLTSVLKELAGLDVVQYPGILSGVSIRGFRPENGKLNAKTLILINGRPAGSANLGMIDLAHVERVEVLKGPASAIYGPTAMGGVVNIVTKNTTGDIKGEAAFSYGSYDRVRSSVAVGGSIFSKMDFDAGVSVSNNPKDYKIGNGNVFRKWFGSDKVTNVFNDGTPESTEDDTRGDGETRPFTKYSTTNMDLRLGYDINASWRVNAFVNHTKANDVESPGDISYGTSPTRKDLSYTSADLSITGKLTENTSIAIKGYYGKDNSDNEVIYEKGAFVNPYRSIVSNLEWAGAQAQGFFKFGQHNLTLGVDYAHSLSTSERFNSEGVGIAPYNQDFALGNVGFYGQGNLVFLDQKLIATLGLRYDINEFSLKKTANMSNATNTENNGLVSPSIGLTYKAFPFLFVKANYGTGFSYADIYQLAGYSEYIDYKSNTVAITAGNKDLKNLKSESFDIGVVLKHGGWNSEITYFRTYFKNNGVQSFLDVNASNLNRFDIHYTMDGDKYMDAAGNQIVGLSTYNNAKKSTIDGLEVSLGYDFGYLANNRYLLNLYASMNTIFGAEEDLDEYGLGEMKHRVLNVANNTILYGLDYQQSKFSAGFKGRYVGYRYDRNWNYYDKYVEVRYPRMMTLDLYAGYAATSRLSFTGYISNVTDENYYEKRGYNLPGRMYSLKATLTF